VAVLVLGPLLGGVLAGYALGGRLQQLIRTRLRAVWLLWLAAALQFVQFEFRSARLQVESALGMSLLIPIFALVAAWLVVNLAGRSRAIRVAIALLLLGGALNAAAIAANGRMPYAESALVAADVPASQKARGERSPKHVAADAGTTLPWLGDVIPVRPLRKVISAGDIVLLAGVATLIAAAMRRRYPDDASMSSCTSRPSPVDRRPAAQTRSDHLLFPPGGRVHRSNSRHERCKCADALVTAGSPR
jgi:hypothetical protein